MTPSEARDELLTCDAMSEVGRLFSDLEERLDDYATVYRSSPEELRLTKGLMARIHDALTWGKAQAVGPLASEMSNRTNAEMEAA